MKLHSKHLFIGTALLAFLFSGCDKNEQIEQQGPIIKDGKILLTAGYNAPRSDSKYTFNVFYNVCFFDNEDSVYVNGIPYAVFPYNGGGDDETDTASSWAHIWVDTNSTGIYKGLYPKSAFTSSIANYENPTVFIPRRVQAIDYNEYTVSSNVHINAPVDGRIIPTTAYTTASSIEDSLIFHNTIAMLAVKLRYHRDFAKAIDPSATAATGYPVIIFDSLRITTPGHPLSGSGYISNPYVPTPSTSAPLLILNAGGPNNICYTFPDAIGMNPKPGNSSNPSTVNEQSIGFLPIITMPSRQANIEIFFTARFNNGVGGPVKHYVYSKMGYLNTTRNLITTVFFHFLTANDFTSFCTELP